MQKTTAHFCTTIIFVTLRLANQKQKQTDVDENSRWPFLLGARKTFSPVSAVKITAKYNLLHIKLSKDAAPEQVPKFDTSRIHL